MKKDTKIVIGFVVILLAMIFIFNSGITGHLVKELFAVGMFTVPDTELNAKGCGAVGTHFNAVCRAHRWCAQEKKYTTGIQSEWPPGSGEIYCFKGPDVKAFFVPDLKLEAQGCGAPKISYEHMNCRSKRWCQSKGYKTGFQVEWAPDYGGWVMCFKGSGVERYTVPNTELNAQGCGAIGTYLNKACRPKRWCQSKGYKTGIQSEWPSSAGEIYCFKEVVEEEPEPKCTDSDGGKNYEVKGTIYINGEYHQEDKCTEPYDSSVNEWYCEGNTQYVERYNCTNGCENGACVEGIPPHCGNGECEYKRVFLRTGELTADPATGKKVVLENVGSGGSIQVDVEGTIEVIPASTKETVNSVDIKNIETYYEDTMSERAAELGLGEDKESCPEDCPVVTKECFDSDGGLDYYVQGYCLHDGAIKIWDTCDGGGKVSEHYCKDNKLCANMLYECPNGCEDGACLGEKPKVTCTDTDGGVDIHTKGTTKFSFRTEIDSCFADGTLNEWYCNITEGGPAAELRSRYVKCPEGCENGACNKPGGNFVTYIDGDPYIGEDIMDPDWVWNLGGLTTTNQIFGIENDFVKNDDTDNPVGVGECYSLPNNFAKLCYLGFGPVPVSDVRIEYASNIDLAASGHPGMGSSEKVIKVSSPGDRFLLTPASGSTPILTNRFYVAKVSTGFAIFYYDPNTVPNLNYLKTLAGVGVDYIGEIAGSTVDTYRIRLDRPSGVPLVTVAFTDNDYEDIGARFEYDATGILSLGYTLSMAELDDLYWMSRYPATETVRIGTKDEDHRSMFGTIIKNPKLNGASDQVVLSIPKERIKGKIEIKKWDGQTLFVGQTSIPLGMSLVKGGVNSEIQIDASSPLANKHELILGSLSPSLETSLTSRDDDYGTNVFMEVRKDDIKCELRDKVFAGGATGARYNFLNKEIRIVSMTDNSITIIQPEVGFFKSIYKSIVDLF